jgi:hypothetical protein
MAAWVLGTALLVAPASAQPQGGGEKLLRQGIKQYDEGNLDGSLRTLEQAARAAGSDAKLLARIHLYRGVCHAVMGNVDKAKAAFGTALGHDPTLTLEPDQFKRSVLEVFRAVQGALKAYLTVRSEPSGAEVIIRGKTIGRTPVERYEAAPGEVFVVVRVGGQEVVRRVELRSGQEESVVMKVGGAVSPPSPAPARPTTTPAALPVAAGDEPAGPSLLRPGTRRGFFSLGLGGGFGFGDALGGFQLVEELGFHFKRASSGPGLALALAQGFRNGSIGTVDYGDVTGTIYRIEAAAKFFWDIQVSSRLAIYIAPFLQAGYVHSYFASEVEYANSFSAQGGAVNVGSDVKMILGDRGLIFVRPVGVLVTFASVDPIVKNDGTVWADARTDTSVHYQLLVGGGVTF